MNNKKIMPKIIASSLVLALGTINAVPALAYSKDETVYSKVKSNGESYQTTVTEHIKNTDDLETLNDISDPSGIVTPLRPFILSPTISIPKT